MLPRKTLFKTAAPARGKTAKHTQRWSDANAHYVGNILFRVTLRVFLIPIPYQYSIDNEI